MVSRTRSKFPMEKEKQIASMQQIPRTDLPQIEGIEAENNGGRNSPANLVDLTHRSEMVNEREAEQRNFSEDHIHGGDGRSVCDEDEPPGLVTLSANQLLEITNNRARLTASVEKISEDKKLVEKENLRLKLQLKRENQRKKRMQEASGSNLDALLHQANKPRREESLPHEKVPSLKQNTSRMLKDCSKNYGGHKFITEERMLEILKMDREARKHGYVDLDLHKTLQKDRSPFVSQVSQFPYPTHFSETEVYSI